MVIKFILPLHRLAMCIEPIGKCSPGWPSKTHQREQVWSINPLVPDAHYSERQDKPFSLQIQRLEVDLG